MVAVEVKPEGHGGSFVESGMNGRREPTARCWASNVWRCALRFPFALYSPASSGGECGHGLEASGEKESYPHVCCVNQQVRVSEGEKVVMCVPCRKSPWPAALECDVRSDRVGSRVGFRHLFAGKTKLVKKWREPTVISRSGYLVHILG